MSLNKLKAKYESSPKFVVTQTKQHTLPIWSYDLQSLVDLDAIEEHIVSQRQNFNYDKSWQEAGGILHNWHSELFPRDANTNVALEKLFEITTQKVSNIWGTTNIYQHHYSFVLFQYLFAIYNKNDFIEWHDHGITEFGAAFYVKVPENSSNIIFEDDKQNLEITVKPGMLIVFPGNARHKTDPSQHEGDRIIITMNFWKDKLIPKPVIGGYT